VIPKERLTAYQRWELASFGDERPKEQEELAQAKMETERLTRNLEQLQEEARRQGHAAGFEQGRTEGLDAGRAQAARELAALRQIAASFGQEVGEASETVAEEMLSLALDLSKAMLKTALKVRPELILPVVSEAIRYLPSLQQPAILALNPEDAAIVRHHMGDELHNGGWRIVEEPQMERGGCRVETASNQIDATSTVRWQRIADALGRQSDWLE
jgi:flagellar assembly protein FliH